MLILGIDPGYAIVGYGVIESSCARYKSLGYGAITTDAKDKFLDRLEIIYDQMIKIIEYFKPDVLSIEKLYFQNNQKTAICVAQARGGILLAAKKCNVPVFEYTPLQIKSAVTGYGQAHKPQVMQMTKRLLRLEAMPKLDDTADALAIAICHANTCGSNLRLNLKEKSDRLVKGMQA